MSDPQRQASKIIQFIADSYAEASREGLPAHECFNVALLEAIKKFVKEAMKDIDPKTGKLTAEHTENCNGCALCERND